MPFHRWIKYASPIVLFVGIAALLYVRLHAPTPKDSLFTDYTPSADGKLWTVIGSADSPHEAYIGLDGSFQPGKRRYTACYYVYDRDNHCLLQPKRIRRSLLDGYLPAPRVEWTDDGVSARITNFVVDCPSDTCFSSITLANTSNRPRSLTVFLAALPYGVTGEMRGGESMRFNRDTHAVVVNNSVLFACDDDPQGFGAVLSETHDRRLMDVTSYIQNGRLPRNGSVEASPKRGTSGAVGYELDIDSGSTRALVFRSPMSRCRPSEWQKRCENALPYRSAKKLFRKTWPAQLNRVKLSLPDERYQQCFYASLAYLMILSDDGAPRPGSAIYDPFWVRDNAYIADAFYYAGRSDLVAGSLPYLARMQLPNGGFRPHTGVAGDSEYDAPGEAIYTFVQHYVRTGDIDSLRKAWPVIVSAARYLRKKRLGAAGILPPSMSAEDLGSDKQQHYWDDFWAIRGLRDAAYAAETLGHPQDASWIRGEANALLSATWNSIRTLSQKHRLDYIPNGPEDLTSSAMARGTSCGLWPCGVLNPSDLFVRSSFDTYWKKWIAPHDGGFEHKNEFWPYAGLDLAMDYHILGQPQRALKILRWTIDHDPTSGFYSWPEGMNIKDSTLAAGDMPHGWTCASYICLIRNILVREAGRDLIIASGVPEEWLAPRREIKIGGFPTTNCTVGYKLLACRDTIRLSLSASGTRMCRIFLPRSIRVTGLSADGHKLTTFLDNRCAFPGSARYVTVRIARPGVLHD
ncbi:MAG: glucosidase family protein [Armatimonadota bacterium]